MLPILFWAAVALVAYTFIGYPIVLAVLTRVRPRRWRRESIEPRISVVISAYNEAALIATKIRNLLANDYPCDRIEILVGCDGSTDGTADAVRAIGDERVHLFDFPQRRGKSTVLNALVPRAGGEIVVLCDVRQKFENGTLRALVRSFADPAVGAVSGEVLLTTEAGTVVTEGSSAYWRYETFIRSAECAVDSSIAVTGPIYAIRKELFEPVPADTLIEDMLIPLRIVRRGYRVVVDSGARALDPAFATAAQEFTRKVRTLAGNFQLFAREPWLFNPLRNRLWWQILSHKALRLLIAPLQITLVIVNAAILPLSPVYKIAMLCQIFFYAGALAGLVLPKNWKKPFVVTVPFVFCLLSWASVLAFLRSITGRQPVTWQKAAANTPSR